MKLLSEAVCAVEELRAPCRGGHEKHPRQNEHGIIIQRRCARFSLLHFLLFRALVILSIHLPVCMPEYLSFLPRCLRLCLSVCLSASLCPCLAFLRVFDSSSLRRIRCLWVYPFACSSDVDARVLRPVYVCVGPSRQALVEASLIRCEAASVPGYG